MLFVFQSDYSHVPVSPLVPLLESFSQPRRSTSAVVCAFQLCVTDVLLYGSRLDGWTQHCLLLEELLCNLFLQGVALTGRNTTGPPFSRGAIIRLEVALHHCLACVGEPPAGRSWSVTDPDRRRRQIPATLLHCM